MASPIIRPLHSDEHEAAAVFLHHCLQATFKGMIPSAAMRALTLERCRRRIQASRRTTQVIEQNATLVGLGQWHDEEITFVYVHPDHHRRGIGKILLAELIAGARRAGHANPWLVCLEGNTAARAFYVRMGGREEADKPVALGGVPLPHVKVVF